MSVLNIISAIGNNKSVYPLIVRDCGIEVPSKVILTYNQNLKDSKQMAYNATRERIIDEYGTSAIWLGGIPLMNTICDWGIKKFGCNPNVNVELYKETKEQGIKLNIEKFKNKTPDAVKDLEKALLNKTKYQKLQAGKFVISTAIPIALTGFILPKLNFKLTEKIKEKQEKKLSENKNNNLTFKGISSTLANMSTLNKMAVTDGGLTAGRVTTARNRYEKMEMGFKMGMMMFLNFVFPAYLAKGLDRLSEKIFKVNVNLDPKLLGKKSDKLKNIELPKENIIEYLDKNPNTAFSKLCEEYCDVKYLENRVRDPRAFVDTKKIISFRNELEKYIQELKTSKNPKYYAKKALRVKSANIIANIGISSFLLAAALPKLTFILRKQVTGSDAEPGLLG